MSWSRMITVRRRLIAVLVTGLFACSNDPSDSDADSDVYTNAEPDADADTDADVDSGADSDVDADSDSDAESDVDAGADSDANGDVGIDADGDAGAAVDAGQDADTAATADYYVYLGAAQNGDGSLASPWNTMASALSSAGTVASGDTVFVWGTATGQSLTLTSADSGAPGAAITYAVRPGYTAVFDGSEGGGTFITFEDGVSHVTFDGLEVRNWANIGFSFTAAETTPCEHITIQNCTIHDCNGYGGVVSGSGECHHLSVLRNMIFNVGSDHSHHGIYLAAGDHIQIEGNSIFGNSGNGIQINTRATSGRTSDDVTINGNRLYNNGILAGEGNGIAIMDNGGQVDAINNMLISNNLIYDNEDSGINFRSQDSETNRMIHNTIFSNGEWGIELSSSPQPTVRNNIVFDNESGEINDSGNGTQSNNFTSDPFFSSTTRAAEGFLKITSLSSGCIGHGHDTNPPVALDFWGMARHEAAPDIGAHEYVE